MKSKGIRNHELTLRKGLFGAEPWSEDIRASIEETLGIEAYDIYGISELMGPGVAGECEYKQGLHIWEDHYIAEIIDSETGKTLCPGERGELVLTTLSREAMPLIRYRTGDITVLDHEQCACGRSHVRMERVLNRSAEFVIVHGVNIYPRDIADILDKLFEIPIRFQVVVSRGEQGDVMEIRILVSDDMFSDEMRRYRHIETTLKHVMTARLSFEPMVRFVEPTSFPAIDKPYPLVVDER
jgi:phenylacetate-CoA ligase